MKKVAVITESCFVNMSGKMIKIGKGNEFPMTSTFSIGGTYIELADESEDFIFYGCYREERRED